MRLLERMSFCLVMKADEFDLEGTKELSKGVYDALGRKSGIVLNKIPLEQIAAGGGAEKFGKQIASEVGLPLVGMIPCMCELMAVGGKMIYTLEKPDHTFTRSVAQVAESLKKYSPRIDCQSTELLYWAIAIETEYP